MAEDCSEGAELKHSPKTIRRQTTMEENNKNEKRETVRTISEQDVPAEVREHMKSLKDPIFPYEDAVKYIAEKAREMVRKEKSNHERR